MNRTTDEDQGNQSLPAKSAQLKVTRISPWKLLQSLSALRIDIIRLKPLESGGCGRGGNADVIPAELAPADFPQFTECTNIQHVAVKKLRLDDDTDDARVLAPLAHEVCLLNDLSHENIVKIIGFVEDAKEGIAWIVLPWEKNGNLREFIASANWEFPERLALIYDVARGINYLHGQESPICHGDLKSLNILVNSENKAVITDFGSARTLNSTPGEGRPLVPSADAYPPPNTESPRVELAASGETITLTGSKWTLRWAAPELLAGSLPDLASDIWAFGWICWEVMTSNFPFDGENDVSVVLQIVEGKVPPVHGDRNLDQVMVLANLMIECWNLNPDKRPTAKLCERRIFWTHRVTPCRHCNSDSTQIMSARLLHSIAYTHMENSRFEEAKENFQRSMDIARSTNDDWAISESAYGLGELYFQLEEHSKAERFYVTARDSYTRVGDLIGFASALKGLGSTYTTQSEHSKAEKTLLAAIKIFKLIGADALLAHTTRALGDLQHSRTEYSEAMESYSIALGIYTRTENQRGVANTFLGLGQNHEAQREYPKAEECYVAAREIYTRIGDQNSFARVVAALGGIYFSQEQFTKAEESFITARDAWSQIGNQLAFAYASMKLGRVYISKWDYSKAEESGVAARDIYARAGRDVGVAHAASQLGEVYRLRGEYSKAEESYAIARDIYTRADEQRNLADITLHLAKVYDLRRETAKAERSCVVARDIYTQIGHQLGFAKAVLQLGHLYTLQGEITKAGSSFATAYSIFTRIGDQHGIAHAVKALGDVYLSGEKYLKAEESYIAACDGYSRTSDQLGLANATNSLGKVYAKQGDYSRAEKFYIAARDIYIQIGNRVGLANAFNYLGRIYFLQGEYPKAEEFYSVARDIYIQIGDQWSLAHVCQDLGDAYGLQKRYNDSEESYMAAHGIFTKLGDQWALGYVLTRLGGLFAEQKNYSKAEGFFQRAREVWAGSWHRPRMVDNLWPMAFFDLSLGRHEEAESLISEAATLVRELGLEQEVLKCEELISKIRKDSLQSSSAGWIGLVIRVLWRNILNAIFKVLTPNVKRLINPIFQFRMPSL